jgi:hypothetical protein
MVSVFPLVLVGSVILVLAVARPMPAAMSAFAPPAGMALVRAAS